MNQVLLFPAAALYSQTTTESKTKKVIAKSTVGRNLAYNPLIKFLVRIKIGFPVPGRI